MKEVNPTSPQEIILANDGVVVALSTFLDEELGVIAKKPFKPGDLVITINGPIIPNRTKYSFQFGHSEHIEPLNGVDGKPGFGHYLNHSCDPNVAIHIVKNDNGGHIEVFALSNIETDQEVTVDYSTMESETTVDQHPCKCKSPQCRQFIHGYKHLSSEKKAEFRSKGLIPAHLLEQDRKSIIGTQGTDSS